MVKVRSVAVSPDTAFGCPRIFLGFQHVYLVISPRARGLSLGINFNPDKSCNFDCVYCEVNRDRRLPRCELDIPAMTGELEQMLHLVQGGGLEELAPFDALPPSLTVLRHVAISGDGEPTTCPAFLQAVQGIHHLRASARSGFFRLVLITNASGLDRPGVLAGLQLFTPHDEIWAKLDVGTQAAMDEVNRAEVPLEKILDNILLVARQRPVIIQSLFTSVGGKRLSAAEINAYANRLRDLKQQGARIPLVQVYSASRPTSSDRCHHLGLSELSQIARAVRSISGLHAEVF
ncbi:MAG TPA: radical SAM protein [Verrucomicrobiales bacterium]|nr:radical SAM protein [Verrucomicrobiales bacterium]